MGEKKKRGERRHAVHGRGETQRGAELRSAWPPARRPYPRGPFSPPFTPPLGRLALALPPGAVSGRGASRPWTVCVVCASRGVRPRPGGGSRTKHPRRSPRRRGRLPVRRAGPPVPPPPLSTPPSTPPFSAIIGAASASPAVVSVATTTGRGRILASSPPLGGLVPLLPRHCHRLATARQAGTPPLPPQNRPMGCSAPATTPAPRRAEAICPRDATPFLPPFPFRHARPRRPPAAVMWRGPSATALRPRICPRIGPWALGPETQSCDHGLLPRHLLTSLHFLSPRPRAIS